MFRFANPIYLNLLALIVVFIAIYIATLWHQNRNLKKFGDPKLIAMLMPDVSKVRRHTKFILNMTALTLLIFLIARPQFGSRTEEVKRSGIEIMIAVDVSNSMLCEDVKPSRLDKSKMIVSKLSEQFDEDKLGLVAFAGSAITLLPMTSDYVSAKMFLNQLTPNTIATQGTNVGEAISKAVLGFSQNKKKNVGKALILITDAEDNEAGAIEAAKEARKNDIDVFVLSVGTEDGGPIPMGGGELKKDINGNVVITKLDEQVGQQIAKAGGGMYIHVDQTDEAQTILSKEIEKMQKEDFSLSMYSEYDEQFPAVAILLLIVLIAEICIMERKNHILNKIQLFKRKSGMIVILMLCCASASAQSTDRDFIRMGNKYYRAEQYDQAETMYLKALTKKKSFEVYYNLGNVCLVQGKDSTAFENYKMADSLGTTNQLKRAKCFHNMGNLWYAQGAASMKSNQDGTQAFQNAVNFYKSSLRCNPEDNETRYNLAKAQYFLKKNQQNGGGGNNNQDQQDKQNQDKNQQKQDQKQDQQNQDKNQQNQEQQQQEQKKDEMSDQNAEQLLNSAQQDEKDVQRKVQQRPAARKKFEKDW